MGSTSHASSITLLPLGEGGRRPDEGLAAVAMLKACDIRTGFKTLFRPSGTFPRQGKGENGKDGHDR